MLGQKGNSSKTKAAIENRRNQKIGFHFFALDAPVRPSQNPKNIAKGGLILNQTRRTPALCSFLISLAIKYLNLNLSPPYKP
jgi:hypothetical protein